MPKLTHYKVFVAVVETGSISQAALHLNYSAPAVSKQLSKFEDNLKVQLFHRSHKKLEITEAGKQFYSRCKDILASISQAEDELLLEGDGIGGTLSITLPKALVRSNIFEALSTFSNKHPSIQYDIRFNDKLENLHDENLDFAFRLGRLHDNSHVVAIPLLKTQLVACATPFYLEQHGIPKSFSDLGSAKLLLMTPRNSSEEIKNFFKREKFQQNDSAIHVCNDIEGVYQSVRANLGVGMLLDISIEKEIQEGEFTAVFVNRNLPRKHLHLLYKKNQWATQTQTAFKNHIKSFFSYAD